MSPEMLAGSVSDNTAIVAVMHANSEVATLNDLASLAAVAHGHTALFFSDAVQTYGKIPVNVKELGIDAMAFCAHKIYGPKGIGALYIKGGVSMKTSYGGSQERNRRGGTEICWLGGGSQTAASMMHESMKDVILRTARMKRYFVQKLTAAIPGIKFNMHPSDSLPHIVSVRSPMPMHSIRMGLSSDWIWKELPYQTAPHAQAGRSSRRMFCSRIGETKGCCCDLGAIFHWNGYDGGGIGLCRRRLGGNNRPFNKRQQTSLIHKYESSKTYT